MERGIFWILGLISGWLKCAIYWGRNMGNMDIKSQNVSWRDAHWKWLLRLIDRQRIYCHFGTQSRYATMIEPERTWGLSLLNQRNRYWRWRRVWSNMAWYLIKSIKARSANELMIAIKLLIIFSMFKKL